MKEVIHVYCDGGSRGNPGLAASAFVAFVDDQIVAKKGSYLGTTTNNQAEYQAVLMAFTFLRDYVPQHGLQKVQFFLDSELVTRQLNGQYRIRDKKLQLIATHIKQLQKSLAVPVYFTSIPREKNKLADRLVNYVLDGKENGE